MRNHTTMLHLEKWDAVAARAAAERWHAARAETWEAVRGTNVTAWINQYRPLTRDPHGL